MIRKINDNWYTLVFESEDGRFACFGYNEEAVKAKFTKWHRRIYMSGKIIPRHVELYNDY